MDTKVNHIEAHLTERSGSTGTSQTCTDDNHVELQLILWVNQTLMSLIVGPFLCYWSFRNS